MGLTAQRRDGAERSAPLHAATAAARASEPGYRALHLVPGVGEVPPLRLEGKQGPRGWEAGRTVMCSASAPFS